MAHHAARFKSETHTQHRAQFFCQATRFGHKIRRLHIVKRTVRRILTAHKQHGKKADFLLALLNADMFRRNTTINIAGASVGFAAPDISDVLFGE